MPEQFNPTAQQEKGVNIVALILKLILFATVFAVIIVLNHFFNEDVKEDDGKTIS